MRRSPIERFWIKVIPDHASGCWLWAGAQAGKDGRPYFWDGERTVLAYRWMWEYLNGPIPDGVVVDHEFCRTPNCVNPAHCRLTDQPDNADQENTDIARTGTFRCGHPRVPSNMAPNGKVTSGKTSWCCRTCRDARNARRHAH